MTRPTTTTGPSSRYCVFYAIGQCSGSASVAATCVGATPPPPLATSLTSQNYDVTELLTFTLLTYALVSIPLPSFSSTSSPTH